jgi:hypothetical protein
MKLSSFRHEAHRFKVGVHYLTTSTVEAVFQYCMSFLIGKGIKHRKHSASRQNVAA